MDHSLAVRRASRAILGAIAVNLALVATKCTAGVIGHSYALIADGVESLSDVISSIIVYGGLRIAVRPADRDHPYGHGKAEPLAALAVAVALILAASLIAVQSIREIRTPHELPAPFTLVVVAGVVAIKALLSRFTGQLGATIDSGAVKGDSAHHFADALTSALAFVGISVGLLTGRAEADDWAALCAVPIIAVMAWRQAQGPVAELLDTVPPLVDADVRRAAMAVDGVRALDKCIARKVGFSFYVDLHVVVDGDLSVRAGHAIAHEVQAAVRAQIPRVADVLVHIEPDQAGTVSPARER
jgi:cation diffusion facilitator family transporter